jgi:hypothetical protein
MVLTFDPFGNLLQFSLSAWTRALAVWPTRNEGALLFLGNGSPCTDTIGGGGGGQETVAECRASKVYSSSSVEF